MLHKRATMLRYTYIACFVFTIGWAEIVIRPAANLNTPSVRMTNYFTISYKY
jgi:hypothetical protein